MSQYIVSIIRTWVPWIIGWALGKLVVVGVILDNDTSEKLTFAITALVIGLYYAAARWLEARYPKFGILLGYIKQPVYVDPRKTANEQREELVNEVSVVAKTPPS